MATTTPRRWRLVAIIGALSLIVTACGGGGPAAPGGADPGVAPIVDPSLPESFFDSPCG